jgi:hypothetical protein
MAQKICTACGNPLKKDAQFCGSCGNPSISGKPGAGVASRPGLVQSPARPPPSGVKRTLPIKAAAVIVIILLIAGAGIFLVLPKLGINLLSSTHARSAGSTAGSIPSDLDSTKVYSFGMIRNTPDSYTLTLDPVKVNKDVTLEKTMTYKKKADGNYAGAMTLHFTGSSSGPVVYRETIPKSFASDVRVLTFSVPPDKIIQADPVVEWNNVQSQKDIQVTSSEPKNQAGAKYTAEDELINSSVKECGKLDTEKDQLICAMEVARKYRDSPSVKNFSDLKRSDSTDMLQAAIVSKDSDKYCHIIENEQEQLACMKAAFMMFVRDCNEGPADAKADCIRKNLWQINNYHTIKGACEYITDPALKAECMGSVDASYCGKIADPALRDKCLANAAQHKADTSLCAGITDTSLRDDCLGKVSLARQDQSICSGIKDAGQRDYCLASVAATKGDIRICNAIADADDKARCINLVGMTALISEKGDRDYYRNLSVCNTDTMRASAESRDLCIMMVAARNINPDLCEQVLDEDSRNTCLLVLSLTGDTSVCTRIGDDYMRDSCFKIIAEGTKDLELCDDIQNEELAAECRNITRHGGTSGIVATPEQLAAATKTARAGGGSLNPAGSICSSPAFKLASKVVARDADAGEGGGGIDPDHCYQAVAVNLGDTSLCQNINRPAPRSKCYLLIAERQGSTDACFLMPEVLESMDSYAQIECIQSVAIKTGDSRICDEMGIRNISRMFTGEVSKTACYQRVASGSSTGGSS